MNKLNDSIKSAQLRRHKTIATGLFLLMVVIYAVAAWLQKTHSNAGLGYLRAFAEAAMVGALADWFAVTALFHHPLGIPIPHTNLIENSKKRIGDNLGGFVVTNFLNAATIKPYIQKLDTSALLTQWLGNEKNIEILVTEISRLLKDIITKADGPTITRFITTRSEALLKDIKLNEVVASGLDIIIQRGDDARILNYLVKKIRAYIMDNEEMIRKRVKQESHFLIPGFVDNIIASKITSGLAKYLSEIETDPAHKIRNDINRQLQSFIRDIKHNPKWQHEMQDIKDSILSGDKIQQYAATIWKQVQTGIITDLDGERSAIQLYLKKTIREMITNLQNDAAMQKKLNGRVQYYAYKYILQHTQKAGELISNTVGNWQGKELSNKLELEVGKDLQFIRINGTLVGGLVGLLIYVITQFIQNS
ncbi:MAG: DUF445 domain-containing protein [Niabella sp.]